MKYKVVASCKECNHPIYGPKSINVSYSPDTKDFKGGLNVKLIDLVYTCECNKDEKVLQSVNEEVKDFLSQGNGKIVPMIKNLGEEELDSILSSQVMYNPDSHLGKVPKPPPDIKPLYKF